MKKNYVVSALSILFSVALYAHPEYQFYGKHFMASYKQCDHGALTNIKELLNVLEQAVHSSGATILDSSYELFSGNGITAFFVLSESHASIHTYPEHNACFVDLFTCGTTCSHEKFDEILQTYLQSKDVEKTVTVRK